MEAGVVAATCARDVSRVQLHRQYEQFLHNAGPGSTHPDLSEVLVGARGALLQALVYDAGLAARVIDHMRQASGPGLTLRPMALLSATHGMMQVALGHTVKETGLCST